MDPVEQIIEDLLPALKKELGNRYGRATPHKRVLEQVIDATAARIYSAMPFETNDVF